MGLGQSELTPLPLARALGQSEARGGHGVSASPSSWPVCGSVVVVVVVFVSLFANK